MHFFSLRISEKVKIFWMYSFPEYFLRSMAGNFAASVLFSYELFLEAEQIMMSDAPVVVLWYNEAHKLRQSRVRSFYPNAMNTWDLARVYIKEPKAKAAAAQ